MNDTLIKFSGPDVAVASYGGQNLSEGAQAVLAAMFLADQVKGLAFADVGMDAKVANIGIDLKSSGIGIG